MDRAFSLVLMMMSLPAFAEVSLKNSWVRKMPKGAGVTAVYLDFFNSSETPLELESIDCPSAQSIEIHESKIVDAKAMMLPVDGLTLPPNQVVSLKPGGLHLMVMGLHREAMSQKALDFKFKFSDGSSLTKKIPIQTEPVNQASP